MKNYRGPTDLFIDVTGYYAEQIEGTISADGVVLAGTPHIVTAHKAAAGSYSVDVDTDASNCAVGVATDYVYAYATARPVGGKVLYIATWILDPTSHEAFEITVTC